MSDTRKLDLKLKRLRSLEGDYRSELKRAEDEYDRNFITREKFLKIKAKHDKKLERLLPKVRRLQHLRNKLRSRGG